MCSYFGRCWKVDDSYCFVSHINVTNELIKGIKPVSGCLLSRVCVYVLCRMYSVCIGVLYILWGGLLGGVMSGWWLCVWCECHVIIVDSWLDSRGRFLLYCTNDLEIIFNLKNHPIKNRFMCFGEEKKWALYVGNNNSRHGSELDIYIYQVW